MICDIVLILVVCGFVEWLIGVVWVVGGCFCGFIVGRFCFLVWLRLSWVLVFYLVIGLCLLWFWISVVGCASLLVGICLFWLL